METQRHESPIALSPAKGIDVARLEKELAALWPSAPESGGEEGRGRVRACVLNLIVYAPAGDDRAALDALLDEVYERNPCRALVIHAGAGEADPDRLEAYVSTRCSLSTKGARQICGEQVTIEAGGAALHRAASAVEPLLVADVPVFLWWKDIPHYEDRLFGRLIDLCDRLVIDSAHFDRPRGDLVRLAAILGAGPPRLAVSDLNWSRLTPWRALAAGFWDVADYRPSLDRLDRVEITYAASGTPADEIPPAALLLAGWLASRLGWSVGGRAETVAEAGHAAVSLTAADGRTVEVELRASGEGPEGVEGAGRLRSLSFYADGGAAEFRVRLRAADKLETVTKVGAGACGLGRVLGFEEWSEGRRLAGELSLHARDAVYEQAVAACARLLEALGRAAGPSGGADPER